MMTSTLKKVMWTFLAASLVSISQPTHAEYVGKGKAIDYFARELTVPPRIGLLENGHPVTHKLRGKAIYFKMELFSPDKPHIVVIHLDSDKWMTVWDCAAPEKSYKYSYVVFEIAENIYFLNWAGHTAPEKPEWPGAWLAAIVVDLNRMVVTDTNTDPAKEGKVRYNIEQMKIAVEDIDKANGDKRYVPEVFRSL